MPPVSASKSTNSSELSPFAGRPSRSRSNVVTYSKVTQEESLGRRFNTVGSGSLVEAVVIKAPKETVNGVPGLYRGRTKRCPRDTSDSHASIRLLIRIYW